MGLRLALTPYPNPNPRTSIDQFWEMTTTRQNVVSDAIQIYTETNADSVKC